MIKNTNKNLNPIAFWRAAAPLNRQKSAQPIFFHKHRLLTRAALASRTPLNPIAPPPPPPPPIIYNYIIEETLQKHTPLHAFSLTKSPN